MKKRCRGDMWNVMENEGGGTRYKSLEYYDTNMNLILIAPTVLTTMYKDCKLT